MHWVEKSKEGRDQYSVVPIANFEKLDEEDQDYQLNQHYNFQNKNRKANACLKFIGTETDCEAMMNTLISLEQDESLRQNKGKQPKPKVAEQAENIALAEHNMRLLTEENETLKVKFRESEDQLRHANETVVSL
jgi:hypothetical protein